MARRFRFRLGALDAAASSKPPWFAVPAYRGKRTTARGGERKDVRPGSGAGRCVPRLRSWLLELVPIARNHALDEDQAPNQKLRTVRLGKPLRAIPGHVLTWAGKKSEPRAHRPVSNRREARSWGVCGQVAAKYKTALSEGSLKREFSPTRARRLFSQPSQSFNTSPPTTSRARPLISSRTRSGPKAGGAAFFYARTVASGTECQRETTSRRS
ncbi:hypothetical protein MCBRY_002017 [Methylocystis bryophila]